MQKVGRNDACPCGSGKKFKKCCEGKTQAALPAAPQPSLNLLLNQAVQAYQARNFPLAHHHAKAILARQPGNADALHMIAAIGLALGKYEEAASLAKQAIGRKGTDPHFHNTYANILTKLKQYDKAEYHYRKSEEINPEANFEVYAALSGVLLQQNKAEEVIRLCETVVQRFPRAATDSLYNNWGSAYVMLHKPEEAVKYFKQALALTKKEEYWQNLITMYYHMGDEVAARAEEEAMAKIFPHRVFSLQNKLQLPAVITSKEDMLAARERFMENIDYFLKNTPTITVPENELRTLPFYHIYHGMNNRHLLEQYAAVLRKACPSLTYEAPHCMGYRFEENRPVRMGCITYFEPDSSIGKVYAAMLATFTQDAGFDVFIYAFSEAAAGKWRLAAPKATVSALPAVLQDARHLIAGHRLDVLHHIQIGILYYSYFLGFARLAPIQSTGLGHPITSGLSTIDYYFSVKDMETATAQEQYTEKLVCFDTPFSVLSPYRSDKNLTLKTRKELSLPEGKTLYLCPVQLHKLHPDFDTILYQLLQRDKDAEIIVFEPQAERVWMEKLRVRLQAALKEKFAALRFIPFATEEDFRSFLTVADAVIDSFPFGSNSTNYLLFDLGVPLVTLPAEFSFGRVGYYMYKRMGMDARELIASDGNDYIEKAYQLAHDKALYARLKEEILQKNAVIFDTEDSIEALKHFLKEKLQALAPAGEAG